MNTLKIEMQIAALERIQPQTYAIKGKIKKLKIKLAQAKNFNWLAL